MLDPGLPYCGLPPTPGELFTRWNLDSSLLCVLAVLAISHVSRTRRQYQPAAISGWLLAAAALVSPLCALSVALFSARVAQHMILVLGAAPLIALGWPIRDRTGVHQLWAWTAAFFVALWFWHMPIPYDATFGSTVLYWFMHITLFGSALFLWRELLHHPLQRTADVLTAGAITSIQMGLLGAVLTFAARPLYLWHLTTAPVWGISPLHDQQLGGVFMWVPGIALFLAAAIRSMSRLSATLEAEKVI